MKEQGNQTKDKRFDSPIVSTKEGTMKLLYCKDCGDVFSMRYEERACICGKSKGKYLDNLNAEFSGPALPLGFHNSSFSHALKNQPEKNWGKDFTAFVIEKNCPTFVNKDEDKSADFHQTRLYNRKGEKKNK